mgnify:FL=1
MNIIKKFIHFNNKKFKADDIFSYIDNDDINYVEFYINSGYDLNVKKGNGNDLLLYASLSNKLEIVKLLLDFGFNINAPNSFGQTPLICACIKN